jgi:putative ABC transport system ATP-binding protein
MKITLKNVKKIYGSNDNKVTALNITQLELHSGNFYSILGPSGSGKTTLLNIITGLDKPDFGNILINESDITKLKSTKLSSFRLKNFGLIFQKDYLIPELTIYENLLFFQQFNHNIIKKNIFHLLELLDVKKQYKKFPAELSAGQRQRVSILRAFMFDPSIIIADEPTSNLDSKNTIKIFKYLNNFLDKDKIILVATHNQKIKDYSDYIINIIDGKINLRKNK